MQIDYLDYELDDNDSIYEISDIENENDYEIEDMELNNEIEEND